MVFRHRPIPIPHRKITPNQGSGVTAPFLSEGCLLARNSFPVVVTYGLQNSLQTGSLLVVGRLSPETLAAAAFAFMFATATAWLIALGGTTALDTLASTAFTGSTNKSQLGIYLQRAFVVLGLLYLPVTVLWCWSEHLFLALRQEPQLAKDAAHFLIYLIPGGLGYIYFEALKKYLQAQGINSPSTYVLLLVAPINIGLNYLLCNIWGFGLLGAPVATGLCYWLCFGLLALYTALVAGHECWGGLSREAFQNMGIFVRLTVLGILHVGAEWMAFEIVAVAAGWLGSTSMAAQSVIMTSDQILNTIPFGIGVAASNRVGNRLGARDAKGAARSAHAATALCVIVGALVLVVLTLTRYQFAKIFTDDPAVIKLTGDVMPYVAAFQIADGLNASCGGTLRGIGKQHLGAAINIFTYYAAALPLGIWLSRHGHGLAGLWVGQCLALYTVGLLEYALVAATKWDQEVLKAFDRMDHGIEETEHTQA
ncbi:MATE family efflux transporter [Aspergillus aculeatinus CBS 121060]|uniref:MATE efflux family protein n=1 Tax=Aspergillus aculeatinus CBS 121060 TaxID=1448322 RepID=A0ACD1GTC8_9EURO|nr:MATE efflux family protein [Aspergillus aculeatinus CBS 121060]RAH64595.1 MATE efflux family protein [Aspergillus aculeatinus CBS 121060]